MTFKRTMVIYKKIFWNDPFTSSHFLSTIYRHTQRLLKIKSKERIPSIVTDPLETQTLRCEKMNSIHVL